MHLGLWLLIRVRGEARERARDARRFEHLLKNFLDTRSMTSLDACGCWVTPTGWRS